MSFKKCKVVMLSTNEKAIIGDLALSHNDVLNFAKNEDWLVIYNPIKQNLYITSDEEIKQDDWFIADEYSNPERANIIGNKVNGYLLTGCKKIIATTNTSLKIKTFYEIEGNQEISLPQPSKQFIEKYIDEYNKFNVITDILVEYNNKTLMPPCDVYSETVPISLKVNPKDNNITIKKVKDSWNREEVIELISDWTRMKSGLNINLPNNFDNWIETNL